MKLKTFVPWATLSGIFFWPVTSTAGVRHSRGLGGVGQPIPRTDTRQPTTSNDVNSQQLQQQPVKLPLQQQEPQQGTPQTIPPYQPVVVPPPVPLQVPTQMSFEPPIQVPQQSAETAGQVQTPGQPAGQTEQVQLPGSAAQSQPQIPQAVPSLPPQPVSNQPAGSIPQPQVVAPALPLPQEQSQPMQPVPSAQPLPPQGVPTLPPMSAGGVAAERYVTPSYGMAGCGLGSMIFKNNVRSEQWMASILNDVFIPQSIVITTGTSNCVDVDEEQVQAEQEVFIDTNLHALRLESARGEGENLRALADLMGCRQDGLFDAFASTSQGQHTFIFSDSQPSAIAERYREALKRSRALKARCERLF